LTLGRAVLFAESRMTSNNIELQIQGAIGRFIADTGSEPKAILLGPMEYLALEYGLRARVSIYCSQLNVYGGAVMSFMGYDVNLKTQPGIDFVIDNEQLFMFANK
jgi:hypothetical protein